MKFSQYVLRVSLNFYTNLASIIPHSELYWSEFLMCFSHRIVWSAEAARMLLRLYPRQ